jgi:hypothetical protein
MELMCGPSGCYMRRCPNSAGGSLCSPSKFPASSNNKFARSDRSRWWFFYPVCEIWLMLTGFIACMNKGTARSHDHSCAHLKIISTYWENAYRWKTLNFCSMCMQNMIVGAPPVTTLIAIVKVCQWTDCDECAHTPVLLYPAHSVSRGVNMIG